MPWHTSKSHLGIASASDRQTLRSTVGESFRKNLLYLLLFAVRAVQRACRQKGGEAARGSKRPTSKGLIDFSSSCFSRFAGRETKSKERKTKKKKKKKNVGNRAGILTSRNITMRGPGQHRRRGNEIQIRIRIERKREAIRNLERGSAWGMRDRRGRETGNLDSRGRAIEPDSSPRPPDLRASFLFSLPRSLAQ